MLALKIHKSYRSVVALADLDLIGKKFEEPFTKDSEILTKQLDIRENFYKSKEVTEEEAIGILKSQAVEDATFNIVGTEAIETAKKAGIISDEQISSVDGIPFALVLG